MPGSQRMGKEILGNIETRLEQVQDQVFDDLFTQKEADAASGKKSMVFGRLHKKLLNKVTFFKSRIDIKKKMREIVHRASIVPLISDSKISKLWQKTLTFRLRKQKNSQKC